MDWICKFLKDFFVYITPFRIIIHNADVLCCIFSMKLQHNKTFPLHNFLEDDKLDSCLSNCNNVNSDWMEI